MLLNFQNSDILNLATDVRTALYQRRKLFAKFPKQMTAVSSLRCMMRSRNRTVPLWSQEDNAASSLRPCLKNSTAKQTVLSQLIQRRKRVQFFMAHIILCTIPILLNDGPVFLQSAVNESRTPVLFARSTAFQLAAALRHCSCLFRTLAKRKSLSLSAVQSCRYRRNVCTRGFTHEHHTRTRAISQTSKLYSPNF
jgi:hypothetical protein